MEKTLEPLVLQVTTLVSSKSPQKKKGKSERAHVLVAAVERATLKNEMLACVEEVRGTGEGMSSTAK